MGLGAIYLYQQQNKPTFMVHFTYHDICARFSPSVTATLQAIAVQGYDTT
jgi:hypothetical protein